MADIKRLDAEADRDKIFALSEFAFQYKLSDEALKRKKNEAKKHIIWALMDEDQIKAKLHLIPLASYINGQMFNMGGIASVATWPEYRRQGSVKRLLQHALQYMRSNGQTLSLLHPFSYSFYRKYGWEHAFSQKNYHIPIERLNISWDAKGYVRRPENVIESLDDIYHTYASYYNGPIKRDHEWWKNRILKDDQHKVIAYNESGQAVGYMLYHVKNNHLSVHELAYHTLNAYKLLLRFIATHDSMADNVTMTVPENDMLPLLVNEPDFEQTIQPYFMARIVDIFAFLKQYSFEYQEILPLILQVTDTFMPENNGAFQLSQTENITKVTYMQSAGTDKSEVIHCDIQQLTVMFIGYKRPLELYAAGLIQGSEQAVKSLERIIPQRQTYFPDFF